MPTVLVVDDAAVDRKLAGGLLEKSPNLSVAYAENGNDALSQLKLNVPDLVLTDLQMPDIDGLQLVTSINQDYPEVPVVLMTAHGSENVAAQALANGAASYVPKNELADNLVETVTQIIAMAATDQKYNRLIQCSTKTEFEFNLENDPELIEPLVDLVQQIVSSMNLCDSTERVRMGVALEHAISNAMIRGNLEIVRSDNLMEDREKVQERNGQTPYRDRRVYVNALVTRDYAQFVIRDEGSGFDTSLVPQSATGDSIKDGKGRGLVLMANFMDEVEFNPSGNQVTMRKRRQS